MFKKSKNIKERKYPKNVSQVIINTQILLALIEQATTVYTNGYLVHWGPLFQKKSENEKIVL